MGHILLCSKLVWPSEKKDDMDMTSRFVPLTAALKKDSSQTRTLLQYRYSRQFVYETIQPNYQYASVSLQCAQHVFKSVQLGLER